ncbi:MAG: PfkB family carbohydrate kinase [Planctomycetota bacterium]|nr:PfkB family carbohydrate kinase [Planctomycetota bacterium]
MSQATLASAAGKLRAFDGSQFNVLAGFDGFVDEIADAVDKRADAARYTRLETISALAERIARAAGLSSNIELVVRQMKLGGNGPIMANAMLQAGCAVTYIGSLGKDHIHPVFADMAARCKACYSLCDPGHTDALEFRDGKLMLTKNHTLKEVNYPRMLDVVGLPRLQAAWSSAHLVALANWTMLPLQTDIWQRLLHDMAGVAVPPGAIIFVDLADPEKRPAQELAEALHLLKGFRKTHRVVLGVNQKESMEVGDALGLRLKPDEIERNAAQLRQALQLDIVVLHPTRNAACATEAAGAVLDGPYCPTPTLTTGAGDNFNAGFCVGLMAGLDTKELLAAGAASSGFYVRKGRSPASKELSAFLEQWAARYGDSSF